MVRYFANSDFKAIKYFYGEADFTPRWSNPVWELGQWDPMREPTTIMDRVRDTIVAVAGPPWLHDAFEEDTLPFVPVVRLSWWAIWKMYFKSWWA